MATLAVPVREHRNPPSAPPGTYRLDPRRCVVDATTRQPWMTALRGRLRAGSGQLVVERDPLDSWVQVDLVAGSLTTGLAQRDQALRGPAVLDVATYPWIRFESTLVTPGDHGRLDVDGDLYLGDRVVPVCVHARLVDAPPERIRVAATATLSWRSLGLGWGSAVERAGMLGDRISVDVSAEFVR